MSVARPITVRCSAAIARVLGARHLPHIGAFGTAVVFLVRTEAGLMFWPVKAGALSNSVGDPANRRSGAII